MSKPKIAFFDFTSCEGCQLTVVDLLQTHLGLLDLVEIVQFREAMTEKAEDYQIAFNNGNHTEMLKMSYEDFERLVQPRVLKISRKAITFPHDPEERWVEDY